MKNENSRIDIEFQDLRARIFAKINFVSKHGNERSLDFREYRSIAMISSKISFRGIKSNFNRFNLIKCSNKNFNIMNHLMIHERSLHSR